MAENKAGVRFLNKVAIVTGGCQGVGKGILDVLLEQGGKVAVFDINDKLGSELTTSGPGIVKYVHCDVRNEAEVKRSIAYVVEGFGGLDLLVNNAGYANPAKTIDDSEISAFQDLLNLNLVAYFTMCKYSLPHLRKTKGSVVNISSILGSTVGPKHMSMYCATKGGVTALTKSLAYDESVHGVRINSIAPSVVRTPLLEEFASSLPDPQKQIKNWEDSVLLRRLAEPKEIGLACLYLAVDATFTTGFELNCTAGSEIGYGVKQ
ncbi:DHB14-like protein [Mya arenaria]|uniref:DHB14-like protein n=1 Tax=Mya arenaria TaxID=6604 RepID=A0ABY7GBS4_MYAAR|nr:17-beta-hydroxysteroid dehydrogenase 14-like [Mya arenaria]WAR31850.1 DHB14-like protein [Mya arenaria]